MSPPDFFFWNNFDTFQLFQQRLITIIYIYHLHLFFYKLKPELQTTQWHYFTISIRHFSRKVWLKNWTHYSEIVKLNICISIRWFVAASSSFIQFQTKFPAFTDEPSTASVALLSPALRICILLIINNGFAFCLVWHQLHANPMQKEKKTEKSRVPMSDLTLRKNLCLHNHCVISLISKIVPWKYWISDKTVPNKCPSCLECI